MDGWRDGRRERWKRVDGWRDGWMEGGKKGGMEGGIDGEREV